LGDETLESLDKMKTVILIIAFLFLAYQTGMENTAKVRECEIKGNSIDYCVLTVSGR
jgi:hypothetical protein